MLQVRQRMAKNRRGRMSISSTAAGDAVQLDHANDKLLLIPGIRGRYACSRPHRSGVRSSVRRLPLPRNLQDVTSAGQGRGSGVTALEPFFCPASESLGTIIVYAKSKPRLARSLSMPRACLHVCGVQWSGVGSLRVSYSAAPRLCAPPFPLFDK